jgi:hypothetical protein
MFSSIKKAENFHIVLWLFKDLFWVADIHTAGMVMIVPTISLAIYITWKTRKHTEDMLVNLSVTFWITANSIWMTGEFFYKDGMRPYAIAFFILGLCTVAAAYVKAYLSPAETLKEL